MLSPLQVVVLVIGLWSCQLCYGDQQQPSGHVNAKTTALEQHQPSPSPASQDATAASLDTLPTAAEAFAVRSSRTHSPDQLQLHRLNARWSICPTNSFAAVRRLIKFFPLLPSAFSGIQATALSGEEDLSPSSDKYSYSIADMDRATAFGRMSMFPTVAATAFEDTTQGQQQRIYVTLPESLPLHVPYTSQHRFGPVLRYVQSIHPTDPDLLIEPLNAPQESTTIHAGCQEIR